MIHHRVPLKNKMWCFKDWDETGNSSGMPGTLMDPVTTRVIQMEFPIINAKRYSVIIPVVKEQENTIEIIIPGIEPETSDRSESLQITQLWPTSSASSPRRKDKDFVSLRANSSMCRICHDFEDGQFAAPCHCKGTVGLIHVSCLEHWLGEANRSSCELCGYHYMTERVPKYEKRKFKSFCIWLTNPESPRDKAKLILDFVVFTLFLPVLTLSAYFSVFVCRQLKSGSFIKYSKEYWSVVFGLIVVCVAYFTFSMWAAFTIRHHYKVWKNWWKRKVTVRVLPPTSSSITAVKII